MSYVVLARKYRPMRFADMVGQEHIGRTLGNAIKQDRVHHAYLFSGARGLGKTTTARIFAKGLVCERGPTPEPCNECSECIAVSESRSVDVMEIDGASNNSVDNIRNLREQVNYLPQTARRKVYIIDEVHMLTTSAFNALLKTLEEPPAHVNFVFATTEPQKVLATILSRVNRLDFKRVGPGALVEYLRSILDQEGLSVEEGGLRIVARAGGGSVRDALTLLDQVIAFAEDSSNVGEEEVRRLLGQADAGALLEMLGAILRRDPTETIQRFDALVTAGNDLSVLSLQVLELLRDLTLVKVCGTPEVLPDATEAELAQLQRLVADVSPTHLGQLFDRFSRVIDRLPQSRTQRLLVEMGLLDLACAEPVMPLGDLVDRLHALGRGAPPPSGAGPARGGAPAGGRGRGRGGGGSTRRAGEAEGFVPREIPTFGGAPASAPPRPAAPSAPPRSAEPAAPSQRVVAPASSSPEPSPSARPPEPARAPAQPAARAESAHASSQPAARAESVHASSQPVARAESAGPPDWPEPPPYGEMASPRSTGGSPPGFEAPSTSAPPRGDERPPAGAPATESPARAAGSVPAETTFVPKSMPVFVDAPAPEAPARSESAGATAPVPQASAPGQFVPKSVPVFADAPAPEAPAAAPAPAAASAPAPAPQAPGPAPSQFVPKSMPVFTDAPAPEAPASPPAPAPAPAPAPSAAPPAPAAARPAAPAGGNSFTDKLLTMGFEGGMVVEEEEGDRRPPSTPPSDGPSSAAPGDPGPRAGSPGEPEIRMGLSPCQPPPPADTVIPWEEMEPMEAWEKLIGRIRENDDFLAAMLSAVGLVQLADGALRVASPRRSFAHTELTKHPQMRAQLEQACRDHLGAPFTVELVEGEPVLPELPSLVLVAQRRRAEHRAAVEAEALAHPGIQALISSFDATLVATKPLSEP